MRKAYNYSVHGTAAREQTWSVAGTIVCDWSDVFDAIMRATFAALTEGKAEYGKPGPCGGPYSIREFHVEQKLE